MCDNDLCMHCAVPCAHFRAYWMCIIGAIDYRRPMSPETPFAYAYVSIVVYVFVAKLYSVAECSTFISGIDQNGLLCHSTSRAKSNQFRLQQYLLSRHNRINLFEWQPAHIVCGKLDRVWQCPNRTMLTHSNRSRVKQIAVTVSFVRAINLLVYHSADRKKPQAQMKKMEEDDSWHSHNFRWKIPMSFGLAHGRCDTIGARCCERNVIHDKIIKIKMKYIDIGAWLICE